MAEALLALVAITAILAVAFDRHAHRRAHTDQTTPPPPVAPSTGGAVHGPVAAPRAAGPDITTPLPDGYEPVGGITVAGP